MGKDTGQIMTGTDENALVLGSTSAHEILDVLLHSLKENAGRVDLWMMRFEILRTLGLKHDFASAAQEANANTTLRRDIDWHSVARIWNELAPNEPAPEGVRLPKIDARKSTTKETAGGKFTVRRFSDIALQIAEAELDQLTQKYQALRSAPTFFTEFARKTREALQRPTPLIHATALGADLGVSARIFLKREDMRQATPDVEIAAAQAHIATLLGKSFIITGNDVDEFSIALAQMAPRFNLKSTIIVRPSDFQQKAELVAKLRGMGAQVEAMRSDELKTSDPREGALMLWTRMGSTCHLALSFGTGPNPYPRMISDFQMLLGYESELQLRALGGGGRPRILVAAVHSEADSIGFVLPYLRRSDVEVFYAEPSPTSSGGWQSSTRLRAYNGARREHAWLRATGRITHIPISDVLAREAQTKVQDLENITISLEDARAVVLAEGLAQGDAGDRDVVVLVG